MLPHGIINDDDDMKMNSVVTVPLHCNSVGGSVFWNIPARWLW